MSRVMDAVFEIPDLLRWLFTGQYMWGAVAGAVLFFIVLAFNNKVIRFLREVVVVVGVGIAIIAYFKKRHDITCLALILLLLLLIVSLLRYLLGTIRQNAINRRIERRALEKAEKRRGSWKDKKGYSGKNKPVEEEPVRYSMNSEELRDVVENETASHQGAKIPSDDARQMPVQNAFAENGTAGSLSRNVVIDAIQKLTDLRDLGVLTDEEFMEKRAWLYSKLG